MGQEHYQCGFLCLSVLTIFPSLGGIKILDGDKILCLFVHFLGVLLEAGLFFF